MNKTDQKIGVLGGGQLGKMLLEAASPLSLNVFILDQDPQFPAGPHTNQFTIGNFLDYDDVYNFGKDKDIITIEIESVNLEALIALEKIGKKVFPQPHLLRIIKDKGLQKQFYEKHNLPTSSFSLYPNKEAILEAILDKKISIPFVQKSRTDGYDGKGVQVVKSFKDLEKLFDVPSLVEELVDIDKEIAVIVARNEAGDVKTFPLVEMEFHPTANLVEFLFSPTSITSNQQKKANDLAINLAKQMEIVGLLAIEFFITKSGTILINEVAPRPHNSGHHTIEACITSQFSQLWRAVLNLPLGETQLRTPAVMINLLGEDNHIGKPEYKGLEDILAESGVYPHLYGKPLTKPFRKMGHITIIDDDITKAKDKARQVKKSIKVISQNSL